MPRIGGIKAILFDKDGTLIDFGRTWTPINRAAALMAASDDPALARLLLKGCGTDPDSGVTRPDSPFASANAREIAGHMIGLGSAFGLDDLTVRLDELFTGASDRPVAIGDIAGLFAQLHDAGLKLGIASSDNEASIRTSVEAIGIAGVTDFIAGYDSGHGVKPQPGMALAFCSTVGCSPGEVALIGDNRHDLAMGRAAGLGGVIGVLSGTGTRETLADLADACIGSVHDLPDLLGI